jgi:hypothetical protein
LLEEKNKHLNGHTLDLKERRAEEDLGQPQVEGPKQEVEHYPLDIVFMILKGV